MLLKGMAKRPLLSKDDLLTPNIDGFMALYFLKGGLKTQKLAKNWFLSSSFFLPWSPGGNPFKPSYPRNT